MERIKAEELSDEECQQKLRDKSKALAKTAPKHQVAKAGVNALTRLRYRMVLKEKMTERFGYRGWMDSVPAPETIGLQWLNGRLQPIEGKRVRA